jgi:uncharacterized protein (TIGR03435 family)
MRSALPLLFLALAIHAQTPRFEVASVKPSTGDGRVMCGGGPASNSPGLFRCENFPLSGYITRAWQFAPYELVAPDWLQTQRFDVQAKVPDGVSREQFQAMLQDLLAKRFGLVAHRETREMAIYALRAPQGGAKLKEWVAAAAGQSGAGRDDSGLAVRRMAGWPMETVIVWLAAELGRPVVDETGLKGRYDIELRYLPGSAGDAAGPSLFDAVREQLGLRLDSVKRAMPVLVVDKVERTPTEN